MNRLGGLRSEAKTRPELRRGREVEADMEVEAEPLDPEALAQAGGGKAGHERRCLRCL